MMERTDLPTEVARDIEHAESELRDLRARIAAWVTDADRVLDRVDDLLPQDEYGNFDGDSVDAVLGAIPLFYVAVRESLGVDLEEAHA